VTSAFLPVRCKSICRVFSRHCERSEAIQLVVSSLDRHGRTFQERLRDDGHVGQ
jgi:hypothetical protein